MGYILRNGKILLQEELKNLDLYINDNGILSMAEKIEVDEEIIDVSDCVILPGLIDFMSATKDNCINNIIKSGYSSICSTYNKSSFLNNYIIGKEAKEDNVIGIIIDEEANIEEKLMIAKNHDLNVFLDLAKVNFEIIKNINLPVHFTNTINFNLISKLKKESKYSSFDIKISQLLNDKETIKYLKDKTIELISNDMEDLDEYLFPLLYTYLVKDNHLLLKDLVSVLSKNIGDIFGINVGEINNFDLANICVYDLNKSFRVNKSLPLKTNYLYSKCLLTIINGKIMYRDEI